MILPWVSISYDRYTYTIRIKSVSSFQCSEVTNHVSPVVSGEFEKKKLRVYW